VTVGDVVLVRHGETEWTRSGRHTSRSEIVLTEQGRRDAEQLGRRLAGRHFSLVLTSPRVRAAETCRLAGFIVGVEASDDVTEWGYGTYEGRTTADIRGDVPGWTLWHDGVPGGETAAEVAVRADRVIDRCRGAGGDAIVFSHGHFLRVLAARWIELPPEAGALLALAPASIGVLGWEREQAVVSLWNDVAPT
jgi:broad specificity phosphatase PhoE